MEISLTKTTTPGTLPDGPLGFGKYFTDHMFLMDYNNEKGWYDPRIIPFQNFSLHPASTVFHYGAEIFEGLKAYRRPDGGVQLFRPLENFKRMNASAARLCLPELDLDFALKALHEFVALESAWVPSAPGTSLYLRPFLFGADPVLGVHPVHSAVFCVIASPVASYYAGGLSPVRIMIETEDVRAVRGGTGYAKCGGNYAASYRAAKKAEAKGYSQVLWLDGVEQKYIEEVGAMNVMFKIAGEIVTPELNGSILPGITRKSCMELLRAKGFTVTERPFSLAELEKALEDGSLEEAWGCGTAAVVSPIGALAVGEREYVVGGGEIGPITQDLYDALTGIQWGQKGDDFGWTYRID